MRARSGRITSASSEWLIYSYPFLWSGLHLSQDPAKSGPVLYLRKLRCMCTITLQVVRLNTNESRFFYQRISVKLFSSAMWCHFCPKYEAKIKTCLSSVGIHPVLECGSNEGGVMLIIWQRFLPPYPQWEHPKWPVETVCQRLLLMVRPYVTRWES